jgi:hypothetical protein
MVLAFLYNEEVTSDEIKDMLLRCCIAEPDDICENEVSPITEALLAAYKALASAEERDLKLCGSWKEAEALFQKVYFKHFPGTNAEDGYGWWPETMPNSGHWPENIVKTVAKAHASRDRAKRRAYAEWSAKEYATG